MIHSFLLIGQSNMAGRGELENAVPVDIQRIKILRNGRWQTMFRPVNPDRAFSGVSLAESFAEAYANKYGVEVGLIPCADGGTSLEQWKEGDLLYENAVYQAHLAMRTSALAGVLWHQGESDCAEGLCTTYRVRFEKLMQAFRRDLNAYDIPFILGGLGDFLADYTADLEMKNYKKVNAQLQEIARENPWTGFVSAEGLMGKADNLHFNANALYEFGLRYFSVYETVKVPDKKFEEKTDFSKPRSSLEAL